MQRLLVNPGTPQAWEIPLGPGVNRIGRNEGNDFTINHTSVSGSHCEITVSDQGVFLRDLGSTNGTFVNRAPVQEAWLQNGHHVQFGAVDLMFETDAATATAPVAPASPPPPSLIPPPPSGPPSAGTLRINRAHPAGAASSAQTQTAQALVAAAPARGRFAPAAAAAVGDKPANFALSLCGVVLGAVLGMLIWHLIYRFTGWRLGIMALATGVLAGVAPQLIGHYRSKLMGVIAAVVTLLAIFAAQYLNAKVQFTKWMDEAELDGYEEHLDYSKRAVEAVPNGTDEEIRAFLAKEYSFEELKVKPEEIEAEDLQEFKEELPELRDMAAGKITREQYSADLRQTTEEIQETGFFKIYLAFRALGLFNIVNIFLGVGAAFLTAKGDGRD
jgi:hypothetical protein